MSEQQRDKSDAKQFAMGTVIQTNHELCQAEIEEIPRGRNDGSVLLSD